MASSREVEWDEAGGNQQTFPIAELKVGDNKFRLLRDRPLFFAEHWVDLPSADGSGTKPSKVICSGDDCEMCRAGIGAGRRNYIPVADRGDKDRVKILEFGPQIGGQLKKLKNDPDYESDVFETNDIKLHREGTGMSTKYTCSIPPKSEKLPSSVQAELDALPDVTLYNAPTPVEEQKRILRILQGRSEGRGAASSSASPSSSASVGEDDFFKS